MIDVAQVDELLGKIGKAFPSCMIEHFDEASAVYTIRFDFTPINKILADVPESLKPHFADFIADLKREMRAEVERLTGSNAKTLQ